MITRSNTLNIDGVRLTGAASSSDCYCDPGFFLGASSDKCEKMMLGADRHAALPATLGNLPLEEGFWRTTNSSMDVVECIVPEACVGGNKPGDYCRVGHTGPYCNVCEDSYSKDMLGVCNSCESLDNKQLISSLLLILGVIGAAFAFKKTVYKKYKNQVKGMKAAFRILFVSYQIMSGERVERGGGGGGGGTILN